MYQIGFDIGGTNIASALLDDDLNTVRELSVPFPHGGSSKDVALLLRNMAEKLTVGLVEISALNGIGVAVPGSIDPKKEIVINAYNLGFHNAPLRGDVQAHFPGVQVLLVNDADAAALAELYKGAFRGAKTAVLFTLGTGIGGGIILNGRLFTGGMGNGVELGHAVLQHGGERCTCGVQGCVEMLCSATQLVREGKRALQKDKNGLIYKSVNGDETQVSARTVIDAAKDGDAEACEIFASYVDALGSAVSSVINILDPEIIALGGGVSLAGDFLFDALCKNVRQKSFYTEFARIVPAQLGNDAGIIGAALLHKDI